MLIQGKLDIAMCVWVFNESKRKSSLEPLFILNEPFVLATPWEKRMIPEPFRREAKDDLLTVECSALQDEPIILQNRNTKVRQLIDHIFSEIGVQPNIIMELGSNASILQYVENNMAVALVPKTYISLFQGRMNFYYTYPRITWQIGMAHLLGAPINKAEQMLLDMFKEKLNYM